MHATAEENIIAMDDEVLELPLLLRRKQVAVLESLAQRQGVTVGAYLRQLIQSHIHRTISHAPTQHEPLVPLRAYR